MNRRRVFLGLLLSSCMLLVACAPAAVPASPLSRFSFSENSAYIRPVQGYEYRAEDGMHRVFFHLSHADEPLAVPAEASWAEGLTGLIRQYGMMGWNGFDKSDSLLLDGTQFSVSFAFADGTSVIARGYGRFPPNYSDAAEAIEAHFLQLLPEDMRGW